MPQKPTCSPPFRQTDRLPYSKICPQCGDVFRVKPSQHARRVYCSRDCAGPNPCRLCGPNPKIVLTEEEKIAHRKLVHRAAYLRRKGKVETTKRPDPLLSLTVEELAYIAGLIDGDGSIRIARAGGRKYTVYPEVFIGMTYKPVMDWLASKFTGIKTRTHNHTQINRDPKWKTQYALTLHGKRAKLLCGLLLPYLRVKAAQARIVVGFPCEGRVAPGVHLDVEIKSARAEAFEQMRILNRRGPAE